MIDWRERWPVVVVMALISTLFLAAMASLSNRLSGTPWTFLTNPIAALATFGTITLLCAVIWWSSGDLTSALPQGALPQNPALAPTSAGFTPRHDDSPPHQEGEGGYRDNSEPTEQLRPETKRDRTRVGAVVGPGERRLNNEH